MYNILCDSLGVDPVPNNGTLRLPLKPVGLHSDEDTPPVETPADPPESAETTAKVRPSTTTTGPPEPTSAAADAPPKTNSESDDEKGPTWWGTLWHKVSDKVDEFKDWTGQLFNAEHDNHPEEQDS